MDVRPCIKCGSTNVLIYDNNYSSFNCGGGKCQACGFKVSKSIGSNPTKAELTEVWNSGNKPPKQDEEVHPRTAICFWCHERFPYPYDGTAEQQAEALTTHTMTCMKNPMHQISMLKAEIQRLQQEANNIMTASIPPSETSNRELWLLMDGMPVEAGVSACSSLRPAITATLDYVDRLRSYTKMLENSLDIVLEKVFTPGPHRPEDLPSWEAWSRNLNQLRESSPVKR
jgi:hypothetical protein